MTRRNYVKGEFIFENNLKCNELISSEDARTIGDGTITRDVDGLITEAEIGDRTITISRDGDDIITGWDDGTYEWTLTRDGNGLITGWGVTLV